ncbi:MAG: type IV pilus assembly protein PilM [Phycisphaerae bacterium]
MASPQAVWGIDLGRWALKALKLRATEADKVEIVGHVHLEHAKVLSQPDADRNELIAAALEKLLSQHDISKDLVVVGVPGQNTLARFTKLPPVEPKRVPDIVRYEAEQQIPFDMDEVIWDYQTFQQEDSPDIEVGIFAMKRELIREHLLHFEKAAIEPIAVQTGPLAVYNTASFDGLLGDETTVLLDLGAENADLIIATKATFWTRTVPIGGNNFTEALVKSFKLPFSKAENLKRTAASSKYARQIFQAMRPVFADLVQELQRSIGFYSSTHRDAHIDKVVCVGAAGCLPGLQKYLQQNLGLTVERPGSFNKLVPPAGDEAFKENVLGYAAAYGLALQGLDMAKVTSNLLPAVIAKQVAWKKKRPAFAAAAACLLLAGGLVWFRQTADMRALAAASADAAPTVRTVDEADRLLNSGPNPALSPRAQAKGVLNACSFFKKELNGLRGQGDVERLQTEGLIELQRKKTFIPRILQAINASVPVPEGDLGKATTPAEVLAAIAGTERKARRQVFIQSVTMQYQGDINDPLWPESMVPMPQAYNDPEAELPGMKIEIVCRTPNADRDRFIADTFMNALRENGRKAGQGFYFDRVLLNHGEQVGRQEGGSRFPTRPATTSTGSRRGGGFLPMGGRRGGFMGKPASVAAPTVNPRTLDPVTLEPIGDDWEFVLWVDAFEGDHPALAETEGGN